ncbi:helix-turn-helix domain-containing protein [Butyrivibrio sp. XPD2002]|uniref:helix-turn-helix domain-containing protein n=1 Tax=Butyrivibrio sp. XPD2002 TaxID=1280665 RepID=UPI00041A8E31|nr:helix-turn-helix transcriptional regulator [Butyrivibrio sp. XPD2002]
MDLKDASKTQEMGIRCRQIRMVKGMSQRELAEKLNVTPQTVSKWEKEGIPNLDNIYAISDALGQNLLDDQIDQEGSVGEVGKEILSLLIAFDGLTDFRNIVYNLYGMKSDRVSNELFKLERIGAVIREQYTDFKKEERDVVFITAKGVVIYKNMSGLGRKTISEDVVTYDEILAEGYNSYQEVIDNDKVTTLLTSLDNSGLSFRCDYITYLVENHFNPRETQNRINTNLYSYPETRDDCLCGESCYIDILRRMMQGTNRKEVDKYLSAGLEWWESEDGCEEKDYTEEALGMEPVQVEALESILWWREDSHGPNYVNELLNRFNKEGRIEEYKERTEKEKQEKDKEEFYNSLDLSEREDDFINGLTDDVLFNCNKWFTEDQIRTFVEENFLTAQTDSEKRIDDMLHKIWEADESTLDYYYSFPKRWEDNGLAKLIRERVGVPGRKENTGAGK